MVTQARKFDRRNLILFDALLLAVSVSSLANLSLVPHNVSETAAIAIIALTSIIGSAVAEWKLLTE